MALRDHEGILIDNFNGFYDRGDIEKVPLDHFTVCNNLQYIGDTAFATRPGIGIHQIVASPISSPLRMYNFPTDTGNTLLVLVDGGAIYHIVDSGTVHGPILTIPEMTDFAMVPYANRAYISPFTTEVVGGLNRERGLEDEGIYVYKGDGSSARLAAGEGPTVNLVAANSGNPGFTDPGLHIFGYVYETDTGYLSPPGGMIALTTLDVESVNFTNVVNSPDTSVIAKHIVASTVIEDYNGDVTGYTLYFIPGATIPNNTTTTVSNISFFDADLLDDASHLLDNFTKIPAGVSLCVYHNRLVFTTPFDNTSIGYASSPGEPEAFNQIDGLLTFPPDGNPITNSAELRDVLYFFKRIRTGGFSDNGDIPATWPFTLVDNAMGCGVHGIGTVLDSGSSNIDFLIVGTYRGIALFNGNYILPELSFKIQNFWIQQNFKNDFWRIQILNDSYEQKIYVILADRTMMHGNYSNGFDPLKIKWSPWTVNGFVNTICFININELIFGIAQV